MKVNFLLLGKSACMLLGFAKIILRNVLLGNEHKLFIIWENLVFAEFIGPCKKTTLYAILILDHAK